MAEYVINSRGETLIKTDRGGFLQPGDQFSYRYEGLYGIRSITKSEDHIVLGRDDGDGPDTLTFTLDEFAAKLNDTLKLYHLGNVYEEV